MEHSRLDLYNSVSGRRDINVVRESAQGINPQGNKKPRISGSQSSQCDRVIVHVLLCSPPPGLPVSIRADLPLVKGADDVFWRWCIRGSYMFEMEHVCVLCRDEAIHDCEYPAPLEGLGRSIYVFP